MDYKDYIANSPYWRKVRAARLEFDDNRCVICRRRLLPGEAQIHHMTYRNLGAEHLTDVVTLCEYHHKLFHDEWGKKTFWRGQGKDHWQLFSLEHTARLCARYYKEDRLICKDIDAPNLCTQTAQRDYIDRYFRDEDITGGVTIDPNDIGLFVRNKRYELFFEAEGRGLTVEEFLDEYYGPKVRGKNPLRQEAGRKNGPFDHEPKSFHRHYKENKNLNLLMEEAKQYE